MGDKGDIIVPAIPALDFGRAADAPMPDASAWPAFMRAPLIKAGKNMPAGMIAAPEGGPEKAFASGARLDEGGAAITPHLALMCIGNSYGYEWQPVTVENDRPPSSRSDPPAPGTTTRVSW
jgi:hypothetical protein